MALSSVLERSGVGAKPLQELEDNELLQWAAGFVTHALATDRCFVRRVAAAKLRIAHSAEIDAATRAVSLCNAALEATPTIAKIRELRAAVERAQALCAGLEKFLTDPRARGGDGKRAAVSAKHTAAVAQLRATQAELQGLEAANAPLQDLARAEGALAALLEATGVTAAERSVAEANAFRGAGQCAAGASLEARVAASWRVLIPPLATLPEDAVALSNVTLGAAGTEFDLVVVRSADPAAAAVEVLAVVEVKKRADDIGPSFGLHRKSLRWLAGERDSYSPEEFRTRRFPRGHFDVEAKHVEKSGKSFVFTSESFARFRGEFCGGSLFFVTPDDAPLCGLSSSERGSLLARITRVGPEEPLSGFNFDDPANTPLEMIRRLRNYLSDMVAARHGNPSTAEVFRMFLEHGIADRIIFLARQ